ncbi:site-specific integrase [Virgibacillus senegalensis]|uniref:site-specific integrase n=1 Tax=Virgibacillus senegalensis TaxID=1499679 RepID=UPI00069F377F|nr:site-specific integrase [Virgibacillus senegalensis]
MNTERKYTYIVKEVELDNIIQGEIERERVVQIAIRNEESGLILPSPLTNFVKTKYRYAGKSLSSQRNPASEVCKFLNYALDKIAESDKDFIELKHRGIRGLKLKHFSRYITYKTREGLKQVSVKGIERYLIVFLEFLIEQSILESEVNLTYSKSANGREYANSPFKHSALETEYPKQRTNSDIDDLLHDFGANRYLLTKEFIDIARIESPEIALGLCLQFYGGLRRGEVVNLTLPNVKTKGEWGERGITLEVRDNQTKLFSHLSSTDKEQVKNPRNQTLLINPLLCEVYKEHMYRLNDMKKRNKVSNQLSLFVNPSNGMPMSGQNYEKKFGEVKEKFLNRLIEVGRLEDYEYLSEPWSTHIGRGVFTNFLLDIGLSVSQLAIARGDKNIDSAISYVEEKNAIENIEKAINEVSVAYKQGKAEIQSEKLSRWKDVYSYAGTMG